MKKLLPAVFSGILASALICVCSQATAGEKVAYQNWIVDISGVTTEAYTANKKEGSSKKKAAESKKSNKTNSNTGSK